MFWFGLFLFVLTGCADSGRENINIYGHVYDFENKPIANRLVKISEFKFNMPVSTKITIAEALTNKDGFYFYKVNVKNTVYVSPVSDLCGLTYGSMKFERKEYIDSRNIEIDFYPFDTKCYDESEF